MTREEIERMKAGPETDKLIAEQVMCWKLKSKKWIDGKTYLGDFPEDKKETGTTYRIVPQYSSDIADSWEVAEKLREKYGCDVSVTLRGDFFGCEQAQYCKIQGGTLKYDNPSVMLVCKADAVPLAICRAALLVTLPD